MDNNEQNKKSQCCGCMSCVRVCPANCIEQIVDEDGFLYPLTHLELCISCDKCVHICPYTSEHRRNDILDGYPHCYGSYALDERERLESSSGGVFYLLGKSVIESGGAVFAVMLDKNMKARYFEADDLETLKMMRGSKYVQAQLDFWVFDKIKERADAGKYSLFVGTPCYAAALSSALTPNERKRVYIIDFICHGVPSPMIFEAFVKNEEKKNGAKMSEHKFRNKERGWNSKGIQLGSGSISIFNNGNVKKRFPTFTDPYINGFLSGYFNRLSCYTCKFKTLNNSSADITIGDFWGVKKVIPELYDKKGTSLVIVHNDCGKGQWNIIEPYQKSCAVKLFTAIKFNINIKGSRPLPRSRNAFFDDYRNYGWNFVEKKYLNVFCYAKEKAKELLFKRVSADEMEKK